MTSVIEPGAVDPVAAHVAALERALHGPARARRSMIDEIRDGLRDAEAAHRAEGVDPHRAAAQAVRDFGAVHEIAPLMQEELTARQARWAALLLAAAFPALVEGWDLLWVVTGDWKPAPTPPVVLALAGTQDTVSYGIAVAALVLLAATFRRVVTPRWITAAVGLMGALGAVACLCMSTAMWVANASAAASIVATHPLGLPVIAGTFVLLGAVFRSAVRSVRMARHCPS
jgi:hypothetical protein